MHVAHFFSNFSLRFVSGLCGPGLLRKLCADLQFVSVTLVFGRCDNLFGILTSVVSVILLDRKLPKLWTAGSGLSG